MALQRQLGGARGLAPSAPSSNGVKPVSVAASSSMRNGRVARNARQVRAMKEGGGRCCCLLLAARALEREHPAVPPV